MSVDVTNGGEFMPLHISAECGNVEATKALVGRCAALNNTNKHGDTALNLAAYNGKIEVFLYLTEKGANINIGDYQ
jgi:ankyrin repeat protein